MVLEEIDIDIVIEITKGESKEREKRNLTRVYCFSYLKGNPKFSDLKQFLRICRLSGQLYCWSHLGVTHIQGFQKECKCIL